jgi:hypothetical protein
MSDSTIMISAANSTPVTNVTTLFLTGAIISALIHNYTISICTTRGSRTSIGSCRSTTLNIHNQYGTIITLYSTSINTDCPFIGSELSKIEDARHGITTDAIIIGTTHHAILICTSSSIARSAITRSIC